MAPEKTRLQHLPQQSLPKQPPLPSTFSCFTFPVDLSKKTCTRLFYNKNPEVLCRTKASNAPFYPSLAGKPVLFATCLTRLNTSQASTFSVGKPLASSFCKFTRAHLFPLPPPRLDVLTCAYQPQKATAERRRLTQLANWLERSNNSRGFADSAQVAQAPLGMTPEDQGTAGSTNTPQARDSSSVCSPSTIDSIVAMLCISSVLYQATCDQQPVAGPAQKPQDGSKKA